MPTLRGACYRDRITAVLAVAATVAMAGTAIAAGIVGTGTPGSCTEAALDAALTGGGTVLFECGPSPHTITVTFPKEVAVPTLVDGGGLVTISGGDAVSIFQVFNESSLELVDITLSRGAGSYGAVQNFGELTLTGSRIELSVASASGGAIENYGTLQLSDSDIVDNAAVAGGAGIFNDGGDVTVSGGEISRNEITGTGSAATGGGGLLLSGGTATVSGTLLAGNTLVFGKGGALYVGLDAVATVTDCTFTENAATNSGTIDNLGELEISASTLFNNSGSWVISNGVAFGGTRSLTITNVTVSGNSTTGTPVVASYTGSAVLDYVTIVSNASSSGALEAGGPTSLSITNSLLANNQPGNCSGTLTANSQGYNLSSDDTCGFFQTGDKESTDPLLGPLRKNGGDTLNHLPLAGSPALEAGLCSAGVETDQRGVARPQGAACDIGAVERAPADDNTTTTTAPTTTTTTTTVTSTTVTSTTVTSTTLGSTTTTLPGGGACGDPVALVAGESRGQGAAVTASDALAVLNAAVGAFACELCVCDVDDSGSIAATDALAVLRAAVDLPGELSCPPCS